MRSPRTLILILLASALLASLSAVSALAADPSAPTPIIELRGDDAQLGIEHGQQLGEQIKFLHEKYLKVFLRTHVQRFAATAAAAIFESRLSPAHRAEIHALAGQTQIDERQVMLGNCFLDLVPSMGCSTVTLPGAAAPDGVARFGRNLDFPALNVADKHTVVLVFHPQGRYTFAAVSWPGLIGCLSGMNEHGLSLANMEVARRPRLPGAMPYTLLYRTVLETSRTVDEAIALLDKTPRQTANNLMLMDAAGGRAVVEITPEKITVRRTDDRHALISTNHQRAQDQQTRGLCRRYDALHDLSEQQFGSIDEKVIEKILAAAAQGNMTLQSMVFEPSNRVIYLATGSNAPSRPFQRIDLKKYFGGSDEGGSSK